MKIAVIGANGKVGSLITNELVEKNLEVTAIVRHSHETKAQHTILKDLFQLTAEDLKPFDTIVLATGFWTPETLPLHTSSLKHLHDLLRKTGGYLLVVGGAGSLYVDESRQQQLKDTPDFPSDYFPLATAMGDGLAYLEMQNDFKWTYLSPAANFDAEGAKSGHYVFGEDLLLTDENGNSYISYADYAKAMVELVLENQPQQKRLSVRG